MKQSVNVASPVRGLGVELSTIGDGVFSEKMLGDGMGILPSDKRFYAPISGTLITLFPTGHAFGIRNEAGVEILVHIGIDTVEIQEPIFTKLVEQGQQITVGDAIVEVNLERLQALGYNSVTMIIVTAGSLMDTPIYGEVEVGQSIMAIRSA